MTKTRNLIKSAIAKLKKFFELPPKITKEEKNNWTKRDKVLYVQQIISRVVLVLIFIMVLFNLYIVDETNHLLFQNTKAFERFSALYQVPDWYSLSEMKVDIDKTYYGINKVVPVFRSVGTQFSIGSGTLTQGFALSYYKDLFPSIGMSLLYFGIEGFRGLISVEGLKLRMKSERVFGKLFWIALILNVVLIIRMLFPVIF